MEPLVPPSNFQPLMGTFLTHPPLEYKACHNGFHKLKANLYVGKLKYYGARFSYNRGICEVVNPDNNRIVATFALRH